MTQKRRPSSSRYQHQQNQKVQNSDKATNSSDSNTAADSTEKIDIRSLQKEIAALKDTVKNLENKVEVLESRLEVSQNANTLLSNEVDNLQQYSRRNCLIVSGIPVKNKETEKELKEQLQKELHDLNINPNQFENEYDKMHRIGKKDGNKQNLIIRFRSHQFPSNIYYNRKLIKNRTVKVKPSLTKRRTDMLREAEEMSRNCAAVHFCFVDFNGTMKIRLHKKFKDRFVHNIDDLDELYTLLNLVSEEEDDYDADETAENNE